MRILVDPNELDTVARVLSDAAATAHELASLARSAIDGIDMPPGTLHAIAPTLHAAANALTSVGDTLADESGALRSRASCCAMNENSTAGALSTLAADSWSTATPSAADAALGLDQSALVAALTGAILMWQASGSPGATPDTSSALDQPAVADALAGAISTWQASGSSGAAVETGLSFPIPSEFLQMGAAPQPGDMGTIGGPSTLINEIARGLTPIGPGTVNMTELQQQLVNNARTPTDLMNALGYVPTGTVPVPGRSTGSSGSIHYEELFDDLNGLAFPAGADQPLGLVPMTYVLPGNSGGDD